MIVQTKISGGSGTRYRKGTGVSNGRSHPPNTTRPHKKRGVSRLWSPWKLILLSVALGLAGSIYLTHVFETQNRLREVQQLRSEHERAQRLHTEVRRNYERMTGPAEVYSRAASLGMITGGPNDPVLTMERRP